MPDNGGRRDDVRRVLILGGPGSGKSTLARSLASGLHVPHVELDRVAHQPPDSRTDVPFSQWTRVPDDVRRTRAAALAAGDGWVAEGLYAGWTAALRDAADVIVWLDLPAWVTTWRVLKRAVVQRLRGSRDWDVRSAVRIARGARSYRTRPLATVEQLQQRDGANGARTLEVFLSAATGRVVRCRTVRQIRLTTEQLKRAPGI